jgi:hypothetical protein
MNFILDDVGVADAAMRLARTQGAAVNQVNQARRQARWTLTQWIVCSRDIAAQWTRGN